MGTVLITGANRGIGLEFCRQYAHQGWQVLACCRQPEQAVELKQLANSMSIEIHKMDVTNRNGIDELANRLENQAIDLVIANAGIYGDSSGHGFGRLNYENWIKTLQTNVLGAVKVIEALLANLRLSSKPRIAVLSSQMGSIDDNSSGGSILYRSSKSALNATMKSVAIDLESEGMGVLIFHPGWVQTDMGGMQALIDANTSVAGMIKQISCFNIQNTGQFIKYDGTSCHGKSIPCLN